MLGSYRWFYYHIYANEGLTGPIRDPGNAGRNSTNIWDQIQLVEGARLIARIRVRKYILNSYQELIQAELRDTSTIEFVTEEGELTEEGEAVLQQEFLEEVRQNAGIDNTSP